MKSWTLISAMAAILVGLLNGCNAANFGGGGDYSGPPAEPPADFGGYWEFTRTMKSNSCGPLAGSPDTAMLGMTKTSKYGVRVDRYNLCGALQDPMLWGTITGKELYLNTQTDYAWLPTCDIHEVEEYRVYLGTSGDTAYGAGETRETYSGTDCQGRSACVHDWSVTMTRCRSREECPWSVCTQ